MGLFRLSPKLDPLPLAWVQLAIAEGAQAIDRGATANGDRFVWVEQG